MRSDYTEYTAVPAEGARVALLSCLTCGALVMVDPRDNESMPDKHTAWHRESPNERGE